MKTCLVTCGPAFEKIDAVRRITNFSTGELGVLLAEKLVATGHRVICCKGEASTWRDPVGCEMHRFAGNDSLLTILQELATTREVTYFFHAAALADFRIQEISDAQGIRLGFEKIPSSVAEINLRLVAAAKILPDLRRLFPTARIVAWKYELEGNRDDAISRARRQIRENKTDACVINGAAYGEGFGLLSDKESEHFATKAAICAELATLRY